MRLCILCLQVLNLLLRRALLVVHACIELLPQLRHLRLFGLECMASALACVSQFCSSPCTFLFPGVLFFVLGCSMARLSVFCRGFSRSSFCC